MGQLSFFSADLTPPVLGDLGGMLAAHGQVTAGPDGARLSILLSDRVRAVALAAECASREIDAGLSSDPGDGGRVLVRTAKCVELLPLADAWTRGSAKVVPPGLTLSAGFIRIWVLAAGHADDSGYLLGVDPHVPENTDALIAACSRTGLAGAYIGVRGGGPGIRIIGHRRLARLVDTVGTLPSGLPEQAYPVESRTVTSGPG